MHRDNIYKLICRYGKYVLEYYSTYGIKTTILKIINKLRQGSLFTGSIEYTSCSDFSRTIIKYYEDDIDFTSYHTDVKVIALYLPQFHEIPENNEWWGKGFTEWTNLRKAVPRFPEHEQPRAPHEDFGYYDLSNVETIKKQVALAKKHNIYAFGIYYYWFSGKRLLEKPVDIFLAHKEIDFPFFLIWANENWTRIWDGGVNNILIKQDYAEKDPELFIHDIKKYIQDSRYIRIDGKPVIGIYNPGAIQNVTVFLKKLRVCARRDGLGEILIWTCATDITAELLGISDLIDGEYEFPPRSISTSVNIIALPENASAISYSQLVERARHLKCTQPYEYYRGSMLNWDNSPRRQGYVCCLGFTPKLFYLWNRVIAGYMRKNYEPEKRFIFVNAMNEWGEGSYLEPDKNHGYACINALSRAVCGLPFSKNENVFYIGDLSITKETDWDHYLRNSISIAVQAHIFYPEMLNELIHYLNMLPYPYDLFITTNTNQKATFIKANLEKKCKASHILVTVVKNKGRDVAPFLIQMKDHIKSYKYFCHIHTKKSYQYGRTGDLWRQYLLQNVLGSPDIICDILYLFETKNDLGIIYPQIFAPVNTHTKWDGNKEIARALLSALHLSISNMTDDFIDFPAGNMFWGRTKAFDQLFNYPWSWSDFPEENGQLDGTVRHAIERLWPIIAKLNHYNKLLTRNLYDCAKF